MARLIAKSPCDGLLPVTTDDLLLSEVDYGRITCLAPFKGQEKAASGQLKDQIGTGLPSPGRMTGKAGSRVVWSGLGQVMVLGPEVAISGAAQSDQSDGWACIALDGPEAAQVLARLTPLDLRASQFKRGHAARSLLGHMTCLFLRTGANRFELLVFRSMAHTAVHELTRAMESVSAQQSLV